MHKGGGGGVGVDLLIFTFFLKIHIKMKLFGLKGGAKKIEPPLDSPMNLIYIIRRTSQVEFRNSGYLLFIFSGETN